LPIFQPTDYFFNPHAVPVAVVAALLTSIGFFILTQNPRSLNNTSFFVICLVTSIWLFGMSVVYCTRETELAVKWYRSFTFLGVSLIAPSIYFFSVSWLEPTLRKKRLVVFGYLLSFFFYATAHLTPWMVTGGRTYFWGHYPTYGPLAYPFLAVFVFYYVASLRNFRIGYRKEPRALKREQIRFIFIAYLLTFFGALDYIPKLFDVALYPVGYIMVFLWLPIVAYSIIRYRLMDIETVVHKTIMWTITSFLFAVPILLLSYFGKRWLLDLGPWAFTGITLAVIVLFGIYSRFIQPRIDHLFQRRRWDLLRVLEKFTDELVHLRELDELSRHIVNSLQKVFYVDEISLFLVKKETGPLECIRSLPPGRPFRREFSFEMTHPFLRWLEENDAVVLQEYIDADPKYRSFQEEARQYFETVRARVCVPLVVSGRLVGIINIGQKANLQRFGTTEINFLMDLRKTTAIALLNSLRSIEMQENLRRWNVELEKKVEERTQALKETQAQLIQAEKLASIGTLAGGIAHEINNPLTAVLTNVQMLKMVYQGEDAESLSLIEEGAKRCQAIIAKLMRYARKSDESETLEKVDLNKIIRSVCDFLGYQLKQEDVDLELSLAELNPIEGIPNELQQVFTNLILNAKDAIRATGHSGQIVIRTHQRDGSVYASVSDNGIGIKKENLVRVFDPFFTTKDVGEGTGLGLTVSSGIVEKFRGKISVQSEEGRGTLFSIQFPQLKDSREKAGTAGR